MKTFEQFLQMGGYAVYVWSAYAITFVVLGLNAVRAHTAERDALAELARRSRMPGSRRDAQA